jgi:hypothetical protein
VTYTLVGDGSSDKVLVPILTWSLKQHAVTPIVEQWADFTRIPRQQNIEHRLRIVLELYPCDVLFVHRDAEAQAADLRREEIANALCLMLVRHIPVVPVRMTEAWLLSDERAIRRAAGNPNGTDDLKLPDLRRLEDVTDPKRVLHEALTRACGLNIRRRSRLQVHQLVHLIPGHIEDYSRLNILPAFNALQEDIQVLINSV